MARRKVLLKLSFLISHHAYKRRTMTILLMIQIIQFQRLIFSVWLLQFFVVNIEHSGKWMIQQWIGIERTEQWTKFFFLSLLLQSHKFMKAKRRMNEVMSTSFQLIFQASIRFSDLFSLAAVHIPMKQFIEPFYVSKSISLYFVNSKSIFVCIK